MDETSDRLAIRALIENWALWRDAGLWDRFRTVWHDDGQMWATWFQGSAEDFIRVSQEGFARGVRMFHMLGGTTIDIASTRVIAQTKMTITQRGVIDSVACEVVCAGRFYDFIEMREGRWGIVLRRLIYEMDRLHVLDPAASLKLDRNVLEQFPVGYRHLAYLQTKGGYTVRRDLPGVDGPAVEALYARGADWLKGNAL